MYGLSANDFWIEPSSIKSQETSRCGFFLYAHSDFTFRNDIITVLDPILKSKIVHNFELEFDVQPEKLNIAVVITKMGERAVMLRSTPTHSERVQQVLTQLLTEDDVTDVKTLKKYMFVPITVVGDDDRSTLQGVLPTQHLFRQNAHHYIATNLWDITKVCQVPELDATAYEPNESIQNLNPPNQETTTDMTANTTANDATPTDSTDDVDMDASTDPDANKETTNTPTTEPYSLREWFYDLTDTDGKSLVHAVYPSSESNKVCILCEKQRAVKVLKVNHNLVDLALLVYFGTNKQNSSVQNYPRATPQSTAYSNHLVNFAT